MLQRYIIDARTIIYDIDLNYQRRIFVRAVSVVIRIVVPLGVPATSALKCWSVGIRTARRPDSVTELYRSEQPAARQPPKVKVHSSVTLSALVTLLCFYSSVAIKNCYFFKEGSGCRLD